MKNKKIILLLLSTCLLTGCDFLQNIMSSTGASSSEKPNVNSSETNSSSNSSSTSNSASEEVETFNYYKNDAYKEIVLKTPDFSTRKINSIEEVTFDDLFNLGNKVSINVEVSDEQLRLLQQDFETGYKSEIYRIADRVDITLVNYGNTYSWSFDQVGIRQKGNTSRENIFVDGKINGLNHFKLSFDETFDDPEMYGNACVDWTNREDEKILREDREFLGLSGVDIKWNKNYDSTHIKEIYASYLYDACNLMTPSIGLTTFSIKQLGNNQIYDFGLCTLFEPTSKSFIKRELKKGPYVNTLVWKEENNGTFGVPDSKYGDYYKASYGVGSGFYGNGADLSSGSTMGDKVGVGNISGSYIPAYERKTNTDVAYDDALLKGLTKAISSGTYDSINKVMDLKYFAITEACNYFIGNPDDLKNNHNNYTIYFRRTDGKGMIIPIDNDRCFGITKDWNPDGHGMTEVGVFSQKPAAKDSVNKLHKKTILATSNDCKAIYLTYVKALNVSSWLTNETFKSLYDIAYATYGNNSTVTSFGDGFNFSLDSTYGNLTFNEYINKKKNMVNMNQTIVNNNKLNSGDTNNNQTSSSETSSSESNEGYYGNIYLTGKFIEWATYNKNYPFTYKGSGVYTITFTVRNVEDGVAKVKIYDGENYDKLDWTIVDNTLVMEKGSSAKIYDCYNGQSVTITINTLTKAVEIVKG